MTYKETVNWMFSRLPMFQRVGSSAYKAKLDNSIAFSKHLGNPENTFKSIHVAGTNGKGSTSHMLASVLQEAGYKVGLYTSPHLKDFRERIKINGKEVSKKFVVDFIENNRTFLEQHALSFFEMTVGMAFEYFAKKKVDIAVIEVGLGGRLDSTNIITPILSVITNIGYDHTDLLGDTLAKIAFEKAGIIKNNIPVVIGEYHSETMDVFKKIASEKSAPLLLAEEIKTSYKSDLLGSYQQKNIKSVVAACRLLKEISVSDVHLKNGLLNVVKNTGFKGRWQQLRNQPKVIADTGHNKEGIEMVIAQVLSEKFDSLHIVLGMVKDKDLNAVLPLFPKNAVYYFCKPNVPRGLDEKELAQRAVVFGLNGKYFSTVKRAYNAALKAAKPTDFIYVGGSTFVVAEIL